MNSPWRYLLLVFWLFLFVVLVSAQVDDFLKDMGLREIRKRPSQTIETGKRSTMLLNKLMHALHKAIRSEPVAAPRQVDLQRRDERWRCYFNAVSCFRRK